MLQKSPTGMIRMTEALRQPSWCVYRMQGSPSVGLPYVPSPPRPPMEYVTVRAVRMGLARTGLTGEKTS